MRKSKVDDFAMILITIRREIRRSEEVRFDYWLRGRLVVMATQSCREVQHLSGAVGFAVQRRIHLVGQGALEVRPKAERVIRPRICDTTQLRRRRSEPRNNRREFGLAATLWNGPVLCEDLRCGDGVGPGVWQCRN